MPSEWRKIPVLEGIVCIATLSRPTKEDDTEIALMRHLASHGSEEYRIQVRDLFGLGYDDGIEKIQVRILTGQQGQAEEAFILGEKIGFQPAFFLPTSEKFCPFEMLRDHENEAVDGLPVVVGVYSGIEDKERGIDRESIKTR